MKKKKKWNIWIIKKKKLYKTTGIEFFEKKSNNNLCITFHKTYRQNKKVEYFRYHRNTRACPRGTLCIILTSYSHDACAVNDVRYVHYACIIRYFGFEILSAPKCRRIVNNARVTYTLLVRSIYVKAAHAAPTQRPVRLLLFYGVTVRDCTDLCTRDFSFRPRRVRFSPKNTYAPAARALRL